MLLLSLETSCDETSAAVVRDGRQVLSNVVASQIDVHARYGGVVPELASRKHLEAVSVVVDEALSQADTELAEIEGIAVTRGPGLIGALLVGLSVAKSMSYALGVPLAAIHHMEGHILSPILEEYVPFPYIALAVSGGHTHLYLVEGIGRYKTLGRTLDDAAGEAFDKVAKLLGLPYPGGILIDRLSQKGDPNAIAFPRPLLNRDNLDFSFSGMKTAVLNHVHRLDSQPEGAALHDIAASFQEAVVDVLARKTMRAVDATGIRRVVVAGGVACNSALRSRMRQYADETGIAVRFPSPALCGDNAAMLAVAGDYYLGLGHSAPLDLNAVATWPLDQVSTRRE